MSQSGLPEVNSVPTLNRLDSGEDSTDEETPSIEKPSPSISQPGKGDPEQLATSHPRLVKALSEVPYSPWFGVLWPIIIEQADFDTRDVLRKVNTYFERLCQPYRDSDLAKRTYVEYFGNREIKEREDVPFFLDLSLGAEWRCWGADKCGFNSVEAFRAFCALGDIDPDQGCRWTPGAIRHIQLGFLPPPLSRCIWISRTKDIIFETRSDPLTKDGYCHYFGLTGVADKAVVMYNFMHDKHDDSVDAPAMTTIWTTMEWDRTFI